MPFNHNHRYHPLLVRQVPPNAKRALDVGCGSGRFARGLAARGLLVEGVDEHGPMIDAARALGGDVEYRHADVTEVDLPDGGYDFISCLASLHHMPFETVTKLRAALAPGGVLAVLGLARPSAPQDWLKWAVLCPPVNLAARAIVAAADRLNGGADPVAGPPIREDWASMAEIRRDSARLLPGRTVRPLLFWRYLLVYRA